MFTECLDRQDYCYYHVNDHRHMVEEGWRWLEQTTSVSEGEEEERRDEEAERGKGGDREGEGE